MKLWRLKSRMTDRYPRMRLYLDGKFAGIAWLKHVGLEPHSISEVRYDPKAPALPDIRGAELEIFMRRTLPVEGWAKHITLAAPKRRITLTRAFLRAWETVGVEDCLFSFVASELTDEATP